MRAYGEALPSLPLSYAKIVRKDRAFYDPADRKKKQAIRRVRQEYGLILPFRSVGNEHKEQTVMSVLTFDKKELGNLEYSLQREMLATDRRGGYMSTTIVCCNTRKYHGLMVAPIDDSDRAYVLLSSVDETVVHDGQSFNLALHRFPGTYEPRGHKYITDFEYTPTPTITYRVGSIVLRKELLWIHNRTQLMIRYTLLEAPSDVRLRLRPFFAFRDKHALTHANMEADGRSWPIPGGVKCRLYSDFPWLYLQTDCRDAEFVPAPDWYYNFEYAREIERGYEGDEDLLTTGYFELSLGRRQSVIFSASVEAIPDPAAIGGMFADAPLWFFWVLQQLQRTLGEEEIWKRYGIVMKELLAAYRRGVGGVAVHDNGLVWASAPGKALTWMNALAGGVPVVSRDGYPVEINALWYNAVCYALELASRFGEEEFVGEWKAWPERIRNAFREMFWSSDDGYLADFVGPEGPNRWIRPNMVVACGLDYKMLDEEQQASVLRIVGQHLLTPKGLRSLSPRNPRYKNRCEGDEAARAEASMNGSVWVWPLWFYVKASFDLGGREFLPRAEELLARFGEEILSYGIGSINELFDGDPPHAPRGAVSQAWSVGAVLMIRETTERWRRRRGHGLLPGLRKKR